MSLKLKQLQKIVANTVKKEKSYETLREEITRVLGPTILSTRGISRMAESANEILDIYETSGKKVEQVRPSLLIRFANSEYPQVRKLISRLLPENFLKIMLNDPDQTVRYTVAKRLPRPLVVEMAKRFPSDNAIKTILKTKQKLQEDGLPKPKIIDEPFDMYGEEPLSSAIEDIEHPGLTDAWYKTQAHKIYNMYGRNIEQHWEEATVHRFVESMKSMGLEVELDKMLDCVYELIEDRKEEVMKEGLLSSLAGKLRMEGTTFMPVIEEKIDVSKQLISSGYTSSEYIQRFEESFRVIYTTSSTPSYKSIREGLSTVRHPSTAKLPGSTYRNVDERAVDAYVNAWNNRESLKSKTYYRLSWSPDAEVVDMVNFHLELK